jgi:DNA-binding HxlR family transcriptional regulator
MATRRYGQYCAIAKALDVLGDRWALLIVRELLFGAMRYGELQATLSGIATDMLATRLRELEAAGVISRGSDDAKWYELTPRGQELRPVLEALAVWGLGELSERTGADAFDTRWLALPLGAMVRPERAAGVTLTVRLVVDGDETTVRVAEGHLDLSPAGGTADADVTIEGPPDALAAAITTPGSSAARRADVRGDRRQVEHLLFVLGLTATPPHSP